MSQQDVIVTMLTLIFCLHSRARKYKYTLERVYASGYAKVYANIGDI